MARDTIEQWGQSLRISRRRRHAIVMELRSHLQECQHELELAGWQPEDAARESLLRLGDPAEIVESFEEVYKPSRRKQLGLAFALATGMLLGAYSIGGSLASATSTQSHHRSTPAAHLHAKAPASLHRSNPGG